MPMVFAIALSGAGSTYDEVKGRIVPVLQGLCAEWETV